MHFDILTSKSWKWKDIITFNAFSLQQAFLNSIFTSGNSSTVQRKRLINNKNYSKKSPKKICKKLLQEPWIFKDSPSSKMRFNSPITFCWSFRWWTFVIISLKRAIHKEASIWYCFRSFNSGMLTLKLSISWRSTSTSCTSRKFKVQVLKYSGKLINGKKRAKWQPLE